MLIEPRFFTTRSECLDAYNDSYDAQFFLTFDEFLEGCFNFDFPPSRYTSEDDMSIDWSFIHNNKFPF